MKCFYLIIIFIRLLKMAIFSQIRSVTAGHDRVYDRSVLVTDRYDLSRVSVMTERTLPESPVRSDDFRSSQISSYSVSKKTVIKTLVHICLFLRLFPTRKQSILIELMYYYCLNLNKIIWWNRLSMILKNYCKINFFDSIFKIIRLKTTIIMKKLNLTKSIISLRFCNL